MAGWWTTHDNPWWRQPDIAVSLDEIGFRDTPVLWDEVEEWDNEAGPRFAALRTHEGVFDDLTDPYADFCPLDVIEAVTTPRRSKPRPRLNKGRFNDEQWEAKQVS